MIPITGAPAHAARLRSAIRQRRVLLNCADATGPPTTRRLRPLAIWAMTDGWMVSGWCELHADFRTWRFYRVATLTEDTFPDDPTKASPPSSPAKAARPPPDSLHASPKRKSFRKDLPKSFEGFCPGQFLTFP